MDEQVTDTLGQMYQAATRLLDFLPPVQFLERFRLPKRVFEPFPDTKMHQKQKKHE